MPLFEQNLLTIWTDFIAHILYSHTATLAKSQIRGPTVSILSRLIGGPTKGPEVTHTFARRYLPSFSDQIFYCEWVCMQGVKKTEIWSHF